MTRAFPPLPTHPASRNAPHSSGRRFASQDPVNVVNFVSKPVSKMNAGPFSPSVGLTFARLLALPGA